MAKLNNFNFKLNKWKKGNSNLNPLLKRILPFSNKNSHTQKEKFLNFNRKLIHTIKIINPS